MTEHKICEKCRWNKYPLCEGIIMFDGSYMNIENLKSTFNCGQKDDGNISDFSINRKSDLELRVEELESKVSELEVNEVRI